LTARADFEITTMADESSADRNSLATFFSSFDHRLAQLVERPRLGLRVTIIGIILTAPCLLLGLYLDDIIGQYIYSNLEGAQKLYRIYSGGYGLASGDPVENHWQIEAGHAPWWIDPHLRLYSFRPVSLATHLIDARIDLQSALLMHAHSLLWLALLIPIAALLFRSVLGPLAGGVSALLFAIDHTHGFIVGFSCNRHALVTAVFGLLCLYQHHRSRSLGSGRSRATNTALAWMLYIITLLAGESGLAVGGYVLAYAAFADAGSPRDRALSFAPYVLITIGWRLALVTAGYGAHGSGLYIEPLQDPLRFAPIFLERLPFLILGQFALPPAELYAAYPPWLKMVVWALGVGFLTLLCVALAPLLRQNRTARFWAAGFMISLVPASLAPPHNRQLLFSSVGAMALVAQLWQLQYSHRESGATPPLPFVSRAVTRAIVLFHLLFSPLALPFTTCSIALAAPMHLAADALGTDIKGRDVVFVTAADFFAVRLAQLRKRIEGQPLPRRWRTLSAGPEQVTVHRTDPRTLVLDYREGMLKGPLTTLFRDNRTRMAIGERISLQGLDITVRAITDD
jgi:hypothetical protein